MKTQTLQVQMLGGLTLRWGGRQVSDQEGRSYKVWLLLAYLLCNRGRAVPPQELIQALWAEDPRRENLPNALKTLLHRARACLDQLGEGAGKALLLRQGDGYAWNMAVPLKSDVKEFERLCRKAQNSPEEKKLDSLLPALSLYKGDALPKLAGAAWAAPLAERCRALYHQALEQALPLLEQAQRWGEMETVCAAACRVDPGEEGLYCALMGAMVQQGRFPEAVKAYEQASELLFSRYGAMPSDAMRGLYQQALQSVNSRALGIDALLEQLQEPAGPGGALVCDYGLFKAIYHSMARLAGRSGTAVHLALFSLTGEEGQEPPRRSLDRAASNLQEVIRSQLRRGDVLAQCSVSQFAVLLPQAGYQDSKAVSQRVIKAFCRQYPHSPATLRAAVRSITAPPLATHTAG